MNPPSGSTTLLPRASASSAFLKETLAGLSQAPKQLLCKFFYDKSGAELFQKICELPEYYITRTELQILQTHGAEMAAALGPNIELIGLGTGAGTKTKILLEKLSSPAVYIPIDISDEQLKNSAERFQKLFPQLEIIPIAADYLEPFDLPLPRKPSSRSVVYFPGSTIGNFEPVAAGRFLRRLVELSGNDGGLLIGVDLRKDAATIEAAYNDSRGITAAFNLNLLARANRELGANFELSRWQHRAIYNPTEGRIEMYLISQMQQRVRIDDHEFEFAAGEKVLTEYSYKHTPEGFAALAREAGFSFCRLWTDEAQLFGVFYFTVAD